MRTLIEGTYHISVVLAAERAVDLPQNEHQLAAIVDDALGYMDELVAVVPVGASHRLVIEEE